MHLRELKESGHAPSPEPLFRLGPNERAESVARVRAPKPVGNIRPV